MGRSTVHYADNKTNNALKKLHNKLRPAGTPVQRVEYIIELLLLRIFEIKLKQDEEFKPLRKLFASDYKWKNPKTGNEESVENRLFSYLSSVSSEQILSELNENFFPFYSTILSSARVVFEENLPIKVQDQLVLIEEVFSNSNFTNNVNSGNLSEVISIVSNDIEEARLLKTDLLGDAIESALSETGGTKDVGLYRTPDHIRQFMTALIEPTFDDIIFDPACGTGGFLFDAFEFVMRRAEPDSSWPGEKAHSELSEWFDDYFKFNQLDYPSIDKSNQFYRSGVTGIEYLGMIRKMASINFYIRGLNPANIQQGDSLAKFNPVTDRESKSVILANPPFGADRDQEAYPDVWQEYSKESETTILFVKLMLEQLKQGGRCAVVVSEGFHTWDQFSARALRKMLLEEAQLKAVISLPQGLFVSKSGSGPKTSILLFEKGGHTDWTWFYKVTNDGYTMGTNRKEQKGNQLVECLNLFHEYVKHGKQPPESKNQFCIPADWIKTLDPRVKEKIRRETRDEMLLKSEKDRKKKIADLDKKIKSGKATETDRQMELKVFDQMLDNRINNEIAKRIDKAHLYSFNLANYRTTLSDSQINEWQNALADQPKAETSSLEDTWKKLQKAKPENALQFLSVLNINNAVEADMAREYLAILADEHYSENEDLAHLNSILKSGAKYPFVKLKDYLILNVDKFKPSKFPDVNYKVLGVSNETGIFLNEKLNAEETNQSYYRVAKNEFCYNPYRINVGSIGLNSFDYDNQIISGAYIVFATKEEELNSKYLDALFKSRQFLDYVNEKANGGVRMNFKFEDMENWEIPLPTLDEQSEIVDFISKENNIINASVEIEKNFSISKAYFNNLPNVKLADEAIKINNGTVLTDNQFDEHGDILAIKVSDLNLPQNSSFILTSNNNVSSKDFNSNSIVQENSVIFPKRGGAISTNKKRLSKKPCVIDNNLMAISLMPESDIFPKYFYFFMLSFDLNSISKTANVPLINNSDINQISFPKPSPHVQLEIINKIENELKIVDGVKELGNASQRRILKYLNAIWGEIAISEKTKEIAL